MQSVAEKKLRQKWRDRKRTIRDRNRRNLGESLMLLYTIKANGVRCRVYEYPGGFFIKAANGQYNIANTEEEIFPALKEVTSLAGRPE